VTPPPEADPARPEACSFEQDARAVMLRVRSSLVDVVGVLPAPSRRAVDLQQALQVDRMTAWRLHRIVTGPDPLGAGMHMLAPSSMSRVLKAASVRGVPEGHLDRVREAYRAFETLVGRYAGDRATFDSMISGFADDDANQVDLSLRRGAFRGQSHVWGVQSRVRMATHVFHPSAHDPLLLDGAIIQGYYDLRRLRPGASLTAVGMYVRHDHGEQTGTRVEPLSPTTGERGTPSSIGFLHEFSDDPPPPMRVRERADGSVSFEIMGNEVGLPATSTCLFGHVSRGAMPWHRTELDTHLHPMVYTRTPAEVTIFNVLLHAATFGRRDVSGFMLGEMNRPTIPLAEPEARRPYQLPMRESVVYAGEGIEALRHAEMPRYADLLAWTLDRLGWDPKGFHAYHCRVEYPPVPSSIVMEIPMPPRPADGAH